MPLAALLLVPLLALQPRPRPTVALREATIHTGDGQVLENATIVLRDGRIEAFGRVVEIPPDAEVIEAKGLFLYPGFLDALTAAGLGDTKRAAEERRKAEGTPFDFARGPLPEMEPANRKGLRAEFSAAERVAFAEADWKKHHAGGFALVHVAAPEEYLGGSTALLVLNGGTRRESLLRVPGQAASFRAYGDGYPTTPMGAMAQLRQAILDASWHRERRRAYEKDPTLARPPSDPTLEALGPVLDGQVPLFFEAQTRTEIDRVLRLAEEFRLRVVVTGGLEAGTMAARLKAAGVPVILSLKFPREPKRPARIEGEEKPGEYRELPKPRRAYEDERREWLEKVTGAVQLHAAGVPFCFSTAGLPEPSQALKKIGFLVDQGLPREAALDALTRRAAELLQAGSATGPMAPGRPATLTVLSAPLGDPEPKVRYLFAEGVRFHYEGEEKAAPPEIDLTGAWKVSVEKSDYGPLEWTLDLVQKGRDLTGSASSTLFSDARVTAGTVSGKSFRIVVKAKWEGADAELELKGEEQDKALKGTLSGSAGDGLSFRARRPE